MELTQRNDRRKLIEEITERWIGKNKETLSTFARAVREMRQAKPYENQGHVYVATIPSDLMKQLEFAISGEGGERLFDPDGELKWFSEKFPEFKVSYDRNESER